MSANSDAVSLQPSSSSFAVLSFFTGESSSWLGRICIWIDPCLMGCATLLAVLGVAASFFQVLISGTILFGVIGTITAYFTLKLLFTYEDRLLVEATQNLQMTEEGLKVENVRLQKAAAQLTKDLGVAKLALSDYEKANSSLKASLSSVQQELAKVTASSQSLINTNKQLASANAERESQIAVLQKQLDTLGKLDQDSAAQKSAIAQEIHELEQQKASFEQSAQTLRASIQELNRLATQKKQELENTSAKLQQATQAAKAEEQRLTESITAKLSQLKSLAQQIKEKQAKLALPPMP